MAMPAIENRKGPDDSGSPSAAPSSAPGRIRFGPATAPTVMDQTTKARSRPRCWGTARSTAAKRACRLAAFPTPSRAEPASSTAKDPVTGASAISAEPSRASSRPVTSARRRPERAAAPANGSAASAAASEIAMVDVPASASLPESSTASSEPMASPAPWPRPLNSCARDREMTTRRWTALVRGSAFSAALLCSFTRRA